MEIIQSIIDNNNFPVLTAFMLGLIVALHPCPLAANIAAMGYIARDTADRRRIFISGLAYTAGRILAYSALGAALLGLFRSSVDMEAVGRWFATWGERVLGPVLIAVGVYFVADRLIHRHEHCPDVSTRARRFHGVWGSFALGVILALSFCPESAIVYFGMLMPMSAKSATGYLLPIVFAVATSIPAVILAWSVAYGISGTTAMKEKMHVIQKWMSTIVGLIFIAAGVFCIFN